MLHFPQEALRYEGAIFWVDASFRARNDIKSWEDIFRQVITNGDIQFCQYSDMYLNIQYTTYNMMSFLVTNISRQHSMLHQQSGAVLIYNTEWAFTNVLWWMYLCSLDVRLVYGHLYIDVTRSLSIYISL